MREDDWLNRDNDSDDNAGLLILIVLLLIAAILVYIYFDEVIYYGVRLLLLGAIGGGGYWYIRKEKSKRLAKELDAIKQQQMADARQKHRDRVMHRDAESQSSPYEYTIGQHAQEALAIRYGIVHRPKSILLQKLKKITDKPDHYLVHLSQKGDRKAIAVLEKGTEYVKTFYPLDEDWFKRQKKLELTLKNNGSFTLEKLAEFHVSAILSENNNSN